MNLPVGTPKIQGKKVDGFKLIESSTDYLNQNFTGYIVMTIEAGNGLEEGILFFKKGEIVASIYEFSKHELILYGDKAVNLSFNAGAALKGIVDVYALTTQQIDLVTAFNEKTLLSEKIGLDKIRNFKVSFFNEKLAEESLKKVSGKEETKYEILKRLGLGKMA
ncbi:MAG TPA: DUF2226 domain-containing protein [archaeon]|nr:DUF2226 domain-containing protein [archaeon]